MERLLVGRTARRVLPEVGYRPDRCVRSAGSSRQGLIRSAWPHGFTHIKLLGDLPVGSGAIEEARAGARYLARYIAQWEQEERSAGLHRYEVAQGFQPGRVTVEGRSADEVLSLASERFGFAPASVWRSQSEKDWHGPPAVWAAWAG